MARYYWLKLPRNFFHRHDMRILRGLPNGEIVEDLFVRLMAESIDHDGRLRFSDEIPYTVATLAAAIETTTEKLEAAMEYYKQFRLVEVLEDGTFYIPKVMEMVGSAENNDNANRQRRYREKQAAEKRETEALVMEALRNVTDSVTKSNASVTDSVTTPLQKITRVRERVRVRDRVRDKEKEKERESDDDVTPSPSFEKKTRFVKPTVDEIRAYCEERGNGIDEQTFFDFYEGKGWKVGKTPMKDWRACIRTWETRKKAEAAGSPRRASDIPYMQNDYSKDHLEQKERDSLSELDRLLEE